MMRPWGFISIAYVTKLHQLFMFTIFLSKINGLKILAFKVYSKMRKMFDTHYLNNTIRFNVFSKASSFRYE